MQDELRLSLLIAGTLFIIAIFAHGMWKIRKQSKPVEKKSRLEPRSWEAEDVDTDELEEDNAWREEDMGRRSESLREMADVEDFDELGLGKVRVVKHRHDEAQPHAPEGKGGDVSGTTDPDEDEIAEKPSKPAKAEPETRLYGSVVTNPKPHLQSQRHSAEGDKGEMPEPPGFLLKKAAENQPDTVHASVDDESHAQDSEVDDFSLDTQPAPQHMQDSHDEQPVEGESLTEQARRFMSRKRSKPTLKKGRQEPKFGEDQMRIDFDHPVESEAEMSGSAQEKPVASADTGKTTLPEQEVLVLNVKAADESPISGAALLPMLLTLGFKFGEQDIFHRHVNSNGKGPVLFSLANMFKPGVFDIDNLETFTTQGVSLFMILPIEGDAHQVFNMMHNAARKIADEFGAQVLDGRRSVMTKQGLQQYIERIREFERLRMVNR
ncbi:cell division protein ZipA [Alteromonas ponticola]|uniref:Cell division protein ZipA n=1 Tax=Alteromonas ponticola TaxID=2720613 RepID=A0ABX1R032_9ALTE|nr:cell division protein ZipA [Alteromonas ponticola]NMH58555.1 cell division protein ZipA [Alteromonas ponticola]